MIPFIELRDVIGIFIKNLHVVISTVLFTTVAGIGLGFLLPPVYEAETDLLVDSSTERTNSQGISVSELDTNLRLIETYKYIVQSPRVLEKVAAEVQSTKKPEEFSKQISVKTNAESQIITVIAQDRSDPSAVKLANTTARIFQEEIQSLMKINNVQILNEAKIRKSPSPVKPDPLIFGILAFFSGVILSVVMLLVKEVFFAKTDSAERVERAFRLPVLGVIPEIGTAAKKKAAVNPRYYKTILKIEHLSPVAEAYRILRTNLQYSMNQNRLTTLLFTSTDSEEGKSLTAGNLAICMAMDNKKTIYIDADLRKGVGTDLFNVPARRGLSTYLAGFAELEEIILAAETPNLFFISKGPVPPNPVELLTSSKIDQMLESLKKQFDVVIFDCPPLVVSDAVALSAKIDTCIYVVNAKKTKQEQALKSIRQLEKVKADILGIVVNQGNLSQSGRYYY